MSNAGNPTIDTHLLRALQQAELAGIGFVKCDVVLRAALKESGKWTEAAEVALCCSGTEDAETVRYYNALRQLIETGYADGKGDLRLPAGPRYTECRITRRGTQRLNQS